LRCESSEGAVVVPEPVGAAALGVGQLLRSCYAALTHEEEEDFPVDDHLQIKTKLQIAVSVDRTRDLQIFSLTLSQLSYPRNCDYLYM
jgi:hypothetical protein